jgi:hypothetical protein
VLAPGSIGVAGTAADGSIEAVVAADGLTAAVAGEDGSIAGVTVGAVPGSTGTAEVEVPG